MWSLNVGKVWPAQFGKLPNRSIHPMMDSHMESQAFGGTSNERLIGCCWDNVCSTFLVNASTVQPTFRMSCARLQLHINAICLI